MDNLTHSLAGLVLAESAVQLRARRTGTLPSPRFRSAAAVASLVAANLPDADLLYTGVGGDRMAYMLHHRGHTHTVLVAVVGAVLLWGIVSLLLRWRANAARDDDGPWMAGLLLAGTLSHLVLDWTNSYGVHPFWPFDNGWLYGDAVFIVEPWFWVVTIPALVAATRYRLARVALSLILVAGLVLAWRVDLVATGAAAALTVGAAASIALARMLKPGSRAIAAVGGWVAVTLVMAAGAAVARTATAQAVRDAAPDAELLDVVVSPLPANPVCASVITGERSGDTWRVARARVSTVPWLTHASACGSRARDGGVFHPSLRPATPTVHWDAEWEAPHAELATLARESCAANAALRFIRIPAWRVVDDSTVMLGDARFGGGSGSGFTDVVVSRGSAACPAAVPPWEHPREELMSAD